MSWGLAIIALAVVGIVIIRIVFDWE